MNLNQVTLPSTDVARSIRYYTGLGFPLIVESPHYARFECPDGDATVSVHVTDSVVGDSGVVVYFEVARLDALVSELQERGYVFDQEPADQRWLWREARLRDPDGNVLCLFHAGSNRKNPPWRVVR